MEEVRDGRGGERSSLSLLPPSHSIVMQGSHPDVEKGSVHLHHEELTPRTERVAFLQCLVASRCST